MDIIQFPMFEDNYGYLLRDPSTGRVAAVDPGDAPRVVQQLEKRGWQLDEIWITHHHWDHAGGNSALRKRYGCRILGPKKEADKIGEMDVLLEPGMGVQLGNLHATVLDVGGHTLGHIAYWFGEQNALFCGDTVFGLGCGRLFEGTPEQMWESLQRVADLPESTKLYCAHEYLLANAGFALSVDPDNVKLKSRVESARTMRQNDLPTVPMPLSLEKQTNPFFQPLNETFMTRFFPQVSPVRAFADLRERRNNWKSS